MVDTEKPGKSSLIAGGGKGVRITVLAVIGFCSAWAANVWSDMEFAQRSMQIRAQVQETLIENLERDFSRGGNLEDLRFRAEEMLKRNPENPRLRQIAGDLAMRAGRCKEAREHYARAGKAEVVQKKMQASASCGEVRS